MSDNSVDNQKQSTLWQSMMRRKQISTMIVKNDELAKNARESMPSNVSDTSGVATAAGATPADHTTTNTTTALTNTTNATTTIVNQTYQRYLSAATVYDLTGVGLSATLAIAVFLMVGYVAKSVAGPSVIISIIIAALIAFLAGTFYAELNCTIVAPSPSSPPPHASSKYPPFSFPPKRSFRSQSISSLAYSTYSPTTGRIRGSSATLAHFPPTPLTPSSVTTTTSIAAAAAMTSPPTSATYQNTCGLVSMKLLLPSYLFTYMCIGEFIAFIIGWNLILEYVIGVAIVSKGLAISVDMLIFDKVSLNITQVTPLTWNLSEYFDFFAFFIPILIGGPLILILRRTTALNMISVFCSLIVVAILLVAATMKANISNWNIIPDLIGKNNLTSTTSHGAIAASDTPAESVDNKGFFPFGIDGMFKGTAIILFAFIAFDAMVLSANDRNTAGSFNDSPNAKNNNNSKQQQQKQRRAKKNKSLPKTLIENFQKTLPASILSVNGMLFICMFGVSVALTLITPHYLLHDELAIPQVMNDIGWGWAVFTVLICGIVALFGSLYALMHAILRTIQTMALDGLVFKFFGGKFESNQFRCEWQLKQKEQEQPVLGCLIFSLLAAVLAGLLDVKQLLNLLSIGTLLVFLTLPMDVILLRYSTNLKKLQSADDCCSEYDDAGGTGSAEQKSSEKISLISILLTFYCLISFVLAIFVKCLQCNIFYLSTKWIFVCTVLLITVMVFIVFIMGLQPKRNSIFELKLSLNPLFPALNIFACIYLLTMFDVIVWIRFIIWMLIGISLYIFGLKAQNQRKRKTGFGFNNNGFVSDIENMATTVTEMEETTVSMDTIKMENETQLIDVNGTISPSNEEYKSVTPDVIPKHSIRRNSIAFNNFISNDLENDEATEFAVAINRQAIDTIKMTESSELVTVAPLETSMAAYENKDVIKVTRRQSSLIKSNNFDEIVFVDDIKDTCIEMKEPNGTAYFIEVEPQDRAEFMEIIKKQLDENETNKDERVVLEMLDKVLGQAENAEHLPTAKLKDENNVEKNTMTVDDQDSLDLNVIEQSSVVALVHTRYDCDGSKRSTLERKRKSEMDNFTVSQVSTEIPYKTFETDIAHKEVRPEENNIDDSTSAEPVKVNEVKTAKDSSPTYATVRKHQTQEPAAAAPNKVSQDQTSTTSKSTPFFHIGPYRLMDETETDYAGFETREQRQNFKEHLKRLLGQQGAAGVQQIKTEPRPRKTSSSKRRPSLQPSKSTPDGLNLEKVPLKVQLSGDKSHIPRPPKFDPVLFNTLNSRLNKRQSINVPATAQCVTNEFEKSFQNENLKSKSLQRTNGAADLTTSAVSDDPDYADIVRSRNTSVLTIRDRLEVIFARGRPEVVAHSSMQAHQKPVAEKSPAEQVTESSTDVPQQPYDMVHKQKILFSDVLRSINPESRTSSNQTARTDSKESNEAMDEETSMASQNAKSDETAPEDGIVLQERDEKVENGDRVESERKGH